MVRLANIYKTAVHRNTPILTRNRVLVEFEWKTTALSGKAGRLILVALSSADFSPSKTRPSLTTKQIKTVATDYIWL